MLSDIISNNSEIIREKTNKGLNNRFILNVSKSKKDEEKNNINIIKKYKEKINIEADNNVDSKSSKLSLREKSVKDMESISIKERNQNNEINSIQKNEDLKVKNNIEMNKNKKNEEALGSEKLIKENPKIETNGDIPESKKIRDNESSKVSNSYDIQSYNNNDQSEILLKDKIIYSNDGRKKENEIKKNDLNTVDSLKQNKSELVSGIINKIPEIKDINEIHNSKNEKDLDIKVNQNIPQTLNSIFKKKVNDEIILNINNSNKENFKIKEEDINDFSNKNINLKENYNKSIEIVNLEENEIHLPNNTLKEKMPELNLATNNIIINEENSKLFNNKIKDINKNEFPINEKCYEFKDSKVKIEQKGNKEEKEKKIEIKKEIIGDKEIENSKLNILNKNQPNEGDINEKLLLNKKEKDTSINNIIKNNEIKKELNKEKETHIFENITGNIIGTPREKYLVEYGSTKGYKRPNIKKGKDFTHNPEILIEGTISGIKNIPN